MKTITNLTQKEIANYCFGCLPEDISSKVLISPIFRLSKVKEYFENVQLDFSQSYGWSGFTGTYKGQNITVINSGQGPARVGDLVLALGQTGCSKIVFLGSIGALENDLSIGDILIANDSIDGEGFSQYWNGEINNNLYKNKIEGSDAILSIAKQVFKFNKQKTALGPVFSIGSLFAETENFLMSLKAQGVMAIDQEISALYTAASYAKLDALALCYVFDKPLESPIFSQAKSEIENQRKLGLASLIEPALTILATATTL